MSLEFSQLMQQYGPLLGRVAASYELNPYLRQELLQEICLAVWQALDRFKGDASIKTYILRVAHNKAVDHVAYQTRQPGKESYCEVENPVSDPTTTTENLAATDNRVELLLAEVQRLPLQLRQVVTLSMEGLSYEEIATITGLKASHVGVVLNRARKKLLETLSDE